MEVLCKSTLNSLTLYKMNVCTINVITINMKCINIFKVHSQAIFIIVVSISTYIKLFLKLALKIILLNKTFV